MIIVFLFPCYISFSWALFKIIGSSVSEQTVGYPIIPSGSKTIVIMCGAVALVVATRVSPRIQLQKDSSFIRTNRANVVVVALLEVQAVTIGYLYYDIHNENTKETITEKTNITLLVWLQVRIASGTIGIFGHLSLLYCQKSSNVPQCVGWMIDEAVLRPSQQFSSQLGRWEGDNGSLDAMEPHLPLK